MPEPAVERFDCRAAPRSDAHVPHHGDRPEADLLQARLDGVLAVSILVTIVVNPALASSSPIRVQAAIPLPRAAGDVTESSRQAAPGGSGSVPRDAANTLSLIHI